MRAFKPEEILAVKRRKKSPKGQQKVAFVGIVFLMLISLLFTFLKNEHPRYTAKLAANKIAVVQKVYGVAIKINGKDKLYVANQQAAQRVLQETKNAALPKSGKLKLKKVYYKENVALTQVLVDKKAIKNNKDAVNFLLYGNVIVQKYIIKQDDNLWSIARRNNMHVKDILAANPGLDSEKLKTGQAICFNRSQPQVTVVAVLQGERKREVPFDTKIVKDKKLRRGNEKVVTEGKNGKRIFTYQLTAVNGVVTDKKVLSDSVAEKPVTKVIASGSARRASMVLASRNGDSSGFIWPKHGHINSPYGYRGGGEFHTGIDIGGSTGDAIVAAASGHVIMAGWDGNYGRCILIDHGNGVVTRYAHLSSISVNEGERVGQGDYIGELGETGRATGPHLHFEVIINGETHNPLRYLN